MLLGLAFTVSPMLAGAKSLEGFTPFSPGFLLTEITGIGTCVKKSAICVANTAVQIKPFRRARCCRVSFHVNQCSVSVRSRDFSDVFNQARIPPRSLRVWEQMSKRHRPGC